VNTINSLVRRSKTSISRSKISRMRAPSVSCSRSSRDMLHERSEFEVVDQILMVHVCDQCRLQGN
jgi:hypothetical protein